MKKQDLEYLLETLKYGLNDCDDKNGNSETHFNSFANAINVVQDELNLLNIHIVSDCADDLEYSLYGQVLSLTEKVKKLEFMVENGLGEEDIVNDITYPSGD